MIYFALLVLISALINLFRLTYKHGYLDGQYDHIVGKGCKYDKQIK